MNGRGSDDITIRYKCLCRECGAIVQERRYKSSLDAFKAESAANPEVYWKETDFEAWKAKKRDTPVQYFRVEENGKCRTC